VTTRTVPEKLGIKPGTTIWSWPESRLELIGPLPGGVQRVDSIEQASSALLFADDAATLREVVEANKDGLTRPEILWVAYPKGNRSDINRDTLWPMLVQHGLRPISQVAIDDVWSALRFRPLREGEGPFTGGQ
jgi:hypothetical protein